MARLAEAEHFYPASLLASLGWPTEKDCRGAAEARFELLQSPLERVMVSTVTLDDEALVEPSTFIDGYRLAGEADHEKGYDPFVETMDSKGPSPLFRGFQPPRSGLRCALRGRRETRRHFTALSAHWGPVTPYRTRKTCPRRGR